LWTQYFASNCDGDINYFLFENMFKLKILTGWAPVPHACNPSYSGDSEQEDRSSKPARANSL
jgi:hypothetical protein